MSARAVAASAARRESPTVNATIEPGLLTGVGEATPSRIVSRAVTWVRTILQLAGVTPAGHDGATSGVEVAPSSITWADAAAGENSTASAATATASKQIRFISGIETRECRRSCVCRKTTAGAVGRPLMAASARFEAVRRLRYERSRVPLDLVDVDRLGALGPGLLLIGDLRPLGKRPVTVAVDAGEMDE